jgi:hypothetical protein
VHGYSSPVAIIGYPNRIRDERKKPVTEALGKRIIALKDQIVGKFTAENWEEVGLLTGQSKTINAHPRLLRSLEFDDSDYSGNVLDVIHDIAVENPKAFNTIEKYVNEKFPGDSTYIADSDDVDQSFRSHADQIGAKRRRALSV